MDNTQQIIEGNKLIAEFDDRMILDESDPKKESWSIVIEGSELWFHKGNLQYHSSWDWLMPVVEKIARSGNYCLKEYQSRTISGRWYAYHISISNNTLGEVDNPFIDITSNYDEDESKVSTYYRFCIEFIKWYNQNTLQK